MNLNEDMLGLIPPVLENYGHELEPARVHSFQYDELEPARRIDMELHRASIGLDLCRIFGLPSLLHQYNDERVKWGISLKIKSYIGSPSCLDLFVIFRIHYTIIIDW